MPVSQHANTEALAPSQLNGREPLLMLMQHVFSKTKCLPAEWPVENNQECLSEIIEAGYF